MKPNWSNPEGLVSKRPIALRLMPEEFPAAEKAADDFSVSKSHLARVAFLKGLPLLTAADFSPSAAPPAADLSGGEASASPAGLSSLAA